MKHSGSPKNVERNSYRRPLLWNLNFSHNWKLTENVIAESDVFISHLELMTSEWSEQTPNKHRHFEKLPTKWQSNRAFSVEFDFDKMISKSRIEIGSSRKCHREMKFWVNKNHIFRQKAMLTQSNSEWNKNDWNVLRPFSSAMLKLELTTGSSKTASHLTMGRIIIFISSWCNKNTWIMTSISFCILLILFIYSARSFRKQFCGSLINKYCEAIYISITIAMDGEEMALLCVLHCCDCHRHRRRRRRSINNLEQRTSIWNNFWDGNHCLIGFKIFWCGELWKQTWMEFQLFQGNQFVHIFS